ncbi:hypothetical protein CRE_18465 [Caenorhabditis remanei]|uniref:Uncharacterized protein n=2 Tax=Caenorhabditis remanei TaxID=31234 RepID=E3LKM9_CAERE|nr:hypothetical protein CRE_18465 [Caenorhabditis remanei]
MNNLESKLSIVVISIGTVSAVFSGILAFLALRIRPTYLSRYQHILVAIGLTGLIYSVCEICTVPYWYVSDGDFVLFAVGPIQNGRIAQNMLLTFAISFIQSLFLISYSFIFQYAQVCRSELMRKSPNLIYLTPIINILIIADWLIAVTYCFTPTDEKMKRATTFVLENMKIILKGRAFLGFSLDIQKSDCLFFIFILNMLILFLILFFCIAYSAKRIISKVSSDLSNRNHFSSIYRLLLVQCISPTLFIIFPCTFNMITGVLGIDLGETIPFILASLLPMYPAINAILIVWQIKDYRNFLFCCTQKKRSNSVMMDRRKSVMISI